MTSQTPTLPLLRAPRLEAAAFATLLAFVAALQLSIAAAGMRRG